MEAELVYTATRCKALSVAECSDSCATKSDTACGDECGSSCSKECVDTGTKSSTQDTSCGTKSDTACGNECGSSCSKECVDTGTKSSTQDTSNATVDTSDGAMDILTNINNTMVKYMGLATAFVPWQNWSEPMSPEQSLRCGTVFAGLKSAYTFPKGGGRK